MNIKISNGNSKIGKDTFILNITSATDCPSKARGLCKVHNICYAMKAERQYKQVLPYRRAQATIWDVLTADQIAEGIIYQASCKRTPIKYLRFSEAGDFRNQKDVNKLSRIADILKAHNIRVYGYTARRDLNFSKVSDNMIINGSGFMVHNSFTAVKTYGNGKVCPGNCRTCIGCKDRNGFNIQVKNH